MLGRCTRVYNVYINTDKNIQIKEILGKQNSNVWCLPFELIFSLLVTTAQHCLGLFHWMRMRQPLDVHFPLLGSGEVRRLTVTEYTETGGRLSHV